MSTTGRRLPGGLAGIQLERAVDDLSLVAVLELTQRGTEKGHADIAPGTGDIGPGVYARAASRAVVAA
jgi:hypothetical protein